MAIFLTDKKLLFANGGACPSSPLDQPLLDITTFHYQMRHNYSRITERHLTLI